MKKHLLLGSALVAAISAFPQNASLKKSVTPVNMAEKIASKFARITSLENAPTPSSSSSSQIIPQVEEPAANLRTANTSAVYTTWNKFTGSANIYGMLVSSSKPLQYHDELNLVTFVHRKSATYVANPTPATVGAATGVLVAMVSTDLGQTWDSTCVWNDNNNWARYPQGGVLNPVGNTSVANASIIATAPITQANTNLGWIGNGFAAKKLGTGTYNNVAGSQTFVANSSPFTGLGAKVDFARLDFTTTDDGKVRTMGQIFNGDVNATTAAGQDFQGARIVTGEFISGNIVWSETAIIPNVRAGATGNLISSTPGMAWSEDGQTGYVYHIGSTGAVPGNATGVNSGFQPIIYKTNDGGGSWALVSGLDFTLPTFSTVLNQVPATSSNSNVTVPFFNISEGISAVVDRNNRLHLVSLVLPSFSPDPDSTAFTINFTNYDGEKYNYLHQPGARPYLYDFVGDGSPNGWNVTVIDSLSSEGPGTRVADDGYASNPWDATGGTTLTDKLDVDARVQVSRTPDGSNIVYTYAETDTNLTVTGGVYLKWNKYPNVKARLMQVSANGSSTVSPTEIAVTKLVGPNNAFNPNVNNRGYMHYASPRCSVNATATTSGTLAINLPITVSSSPGQLEQLNPVNHWYSTAGLVFLASAPSTPVGISENNASVSNSMIYPNPAKTNAVLAIDLKSNSKVDIAVMNMVGQTVKSSKAQGQVGENTINIDLNGLSKGIYIVNVKVDNATSTKKLVIE